MVQTQENTIRPEFKRFVDEYREEILKQLDKCLNDYEVEVNVDDEDECPTYLTSTSVSCPFFIQVEGPEPDDEYKVCESIWVEGALYGGCNGRCFEGEELGLISDCYFSIVTWYDEEETCYDFVDKYEDPKWQPKENSLTKAELKYLADLLLRG